jgi:hypothetical protein
MDTVIIVLKVGLILYAIYSLIVYATRRSGNRSAFKDFQSAAVLRRITDEEKSALQPFLIGQGLTADDDVRELTGTFVRHGLESQGSATTHDTIGDVDVLLPYDAIDFVESYNEALVVLSKKCAVVIRLNGFDLLEGRQRAQRQQAQDKQWKRGEVGALPNIDEPADGVDPLAPIAASEAASVAANPNARFERGEVDILSQRTETPDEVASRVGRGQGWASALVWLVAFILLWLATWDATRGAHVYLLGAGLLAGLCAVWLFLRRPSATSFVRQPQPVNRVRGMLNQIAVVNASNASIKRVGLFIGDKLSFVLPSDWSNAREMPHGEVIEAELRTSDYSAVSFGDKWSVADEWRRFRPVFWGRHLLHLLIGLLAAVALFLAAPDLRGEAALVVQWFSHDNKSPTYTEAQQLVDNPPKWASYVSAKGEGRCEIDLSGKINKSGNGADGNDRTVPMVDCTTMRWNGSAPVVPALEIPESIQALGSPAFLRASENGMAASLIEMLRMQMGQAPDPLSAYRVAREHADDRAAFRPLGRRHRSRLQRERRAFAGRLRHAAARHRERGRCHGGKRRHRHAHPQLGGAVGQRAARQGKRRPRGVAPPARVDAACRPPGGRQLRRDAHRGGHSVHRAGQGRRGAGVHRADRRRAAQAGWRCQHRRGRGGQCCRRRCGGGRGRGRGRRQRFFAARPLDAPAAQRRTRGRAALRAGGPCHGKRHRRSGRSHRAHRPRPRPGAGGIGRRRMA